MPDNFGQQAVGFGVNTATSRLASMAGNRLPLPNFYNPNSPDHFGDSEAGRMLHGNGAAWRRFGFRQGGRALGALLGNVVLPGFGGLVGGMFGNWLGGKIGGEDHQPTGTVTVGNINDTSGFGGMQQIDPWTGAPMPQFSGQGPYASGYQGLPDSGSGGPTMPNFDMSDQYNGYRDEQGNPLWDPSNVNPALDENGDGHVTPGERRDATDSGLGRNNAFGQGVTNFMVGGSPVINGVRTTDMNSLIMARQVDQGG